MSATDYIGQACCKLCPVILSLKENLDYKRKFHFNGLHLLPAVMHQVLYLRLCGSQDNEKHSWCLFSNSYP